MKCREKMIKDRILWDALSCVSGNSEAMKKTEKHSRDDGWEFFKLMKAVESQGQVLRVLPDPNRANFKIHTQTLYCSSAKRKATKHQELVDNRRALRKYWKEHSRCTEDVKREERMDSSAYCKYVPRTKIWCTAHCSRPSWERRTTPVIWVRIYVLR